MRNSKPEMPNRLTRSMPTCARVRSREMVRLSQLTLPCLFLKGKNRLGHADLRIPPPSSLTSIIARWPTCQIATHITLAPAVPALRTKFHSNCCFFSHSNGTKPMQNMSKSCNVDYQGSDAQRFSLINYKTGRQNHC